MKISRSCKIEALNWGALPELPARLERLGIEVLSVSVELNRFPDTVTYSSLDEAVSDVQTNDTPDYYSIFVNGKRSEQTFTLQINRLLNLRDQECLYITADGLGRIDDFEQITQFLALKPFELISLPPRQPKTAFIAHRFDSCGIECADKIARFLELLGFSVLTGRAYSPQSISDKVRSRMEKQSLVFVILTTGTDDTWLIQESMLGKMKGKPLIIVKENLFDFTGGLLADQEYIPFVLPNIETTFIPILEGLRDLGFLNS